MMAVPPPPGARARGFTLLELALALVLITVAAVIAVPYFYGRPAVTLDNAAILLARDLRAAQNHAVYRDDEVRVEFFRDGSGYRAVLASGEPVPNPGGPGPLLRRYPADAVFEGVRVELGESGGSTVRFTPEGLAANALGLSLTYRDEARWISLAAGSGLVEIEGLERRWTDAGH